MRNPLLFVPLDGLAERFDSTLAIAQRLADKFSPESGLAFKVNDDFVSQVGLASAFTSLASLSFFQFFFDLKMFKGRRTMLETTRELVELKVDYFNMYALADEEMREPVAATVGTNTKALGLTVLSHFDEAYCQRHFGRSFAEEVEFLTLTAMNNGCYGVILPGTMLPVVSHHATFKVATGIRPKWYQPDGRHAQEVTPAFAVANGADALVCGGPIMKSSDPVEACGRILDEMKR